MYKMGNYCGFIEVYSGKNTGSKYGIIRPMDELGRDLAYTIKNNILYTVAIFKIKLKSTWQTN